MPKEYESKFLDIDISSMRKKLNKIGAKPKHKLLKYVRAVFFPCDKKIKGYARVRQEDNKITMTVKLYKEGKYPEEYELEVKNSFEDASNFLIACGLEQKAYQETYREKWVHPLAHEITFDIIPGLPFYMEVDCMTEQNHDKLVKLLDLDKSKQRFGAFDKTYQEYYDIEPQVINDKTSSLTFTNIKKEIKPKKNIKLFKQIITLDKNINKLYKQNKLDKIFKEYSKFHKKYLL